MPVTGTGRGPSARRRVVAAGAAACLAACLWAAPAMAAGGAAGASGTDGRAASEASASAGALKAVQAAGTAAGGAEEGSAAGGAAVEAPAENEACVSCHTSEGDSTQDSSTIASLHAGVACVTCHDDGEELDELHAKTKAKRMPMRLKKTQVEDATCLSCHQEQPGTDAFLALSKDKPLVDANGLEVNAHEMVGREGHEGIGCVSCHEVHDEADPAGRAQKVCATCHHAGVYECYTCHEHS